MMRGGVCRFTRTLDRSTCPKGGRMADAKAADTTGRVRDAAHGPAIMTPLISTLVVNLIPALCVVAFGWSAFTLVLLYWIENLIIGGFNVVKILIVGFTCGRAGTLGALALTPFFIFHYGLFCFVHGLFIFTMFSVGLDGDPPPAFNLTDLSALVIQAIPHCSGTSSSWLLSISISSCAIGSAVCAGASSIHLPRCSLLTPASSWCI